MIGSLNFSSSSRSLIALMLLVILPLFLLSPLPVLCLIFFYFVIVDHATFSFTRDLGSLIYFSGFLCAVFVSFVNSVKIPENDLVWYIDFYEKASHTTFIDYLTGEGSITGESKEPVYYALAWIMNRLFFGDVILFKFSISLIIYLFLNISIIKFCGYFNFTRSKFIIAIFLMTFIPYIFTMSLQLVRQMLSCSILVYVIVNACFYGRRNWFLFLCAVLIHNTSVFFLPFLIFPFFDNSFKRSKFYYILSLLVLIGIQAVSGFLLNISLLSDITALQRAASGTTFELEALSMSKIILTLVLALFFSFLAYFDNRLNYIKGIRRFSNIVIFLSFFILVNLSQSELSNRFLFYLFVFFPFGIVLFIDRFKVNFLLCSTFVFSIVLFWSFYLQIGTWTYEIPSNVWFTPLIYYYI